MLSSTIVNERWTGNATEEKMKKTFGKHQQLAFELRGNHSYISLVIYNYIIERNFSLEILPLLILLYSYLSYFPEVGVDIMNTWRRGYPTKLWKEDNTKDATGGVAFHDFVKSECIPYASSRCTWLTLILNKKINSNTICGIFSIACCTSRCLPSFSLWLLKLSEA